MVGEIKVNITFWTEQEEQELRQILDEVASRFVGQKDTPEVRARADQELQAAGRAWLASHPPRCSVISKK